MSVLEQIDPEVKKEVREFLNKRASQGKSMWPGIVHKDLVKKFDLTVKQAVALVVAWNLYEL